MILRRLLTQYGVRDPGDSGYGQTNTVSPVDTSTTVPSIQWTTLLARISSAASSKAVVLQVLVVPSTGDQIEAFSALIQQILQQLQLID